MADQLEQVRPLDRVASSENKYRDSQCGNLVDQALSLGRAEFHGMSIRLRRSSAMDARQVAGLRNFPNGDEWALIEIDRIDLRVHSPIRLREALPAQ
jgi:hypothetical protein